MTASTYRTRVRIIEAFRWQGQPQIDWPHWATPELLAQSGSALYAYTHQGPVRVNRGDWCILGEKEIYPCTDAEFHKQYEAWMAPVTQTVAPSRGVEGDFNTANLQYAEGERASESGAPLSGDLDATTFGRRS